MNRKLFLTVIKELNQEKELLAKIDEKKIIMIGIKTDVLIQDFKRIMIKLDDAGLTDDVPENCIDFFEENLDEFIPKKDTEKIEEEIVEEPPVEEVVEEIEEEPEQEPVEEEKESFAEELSKETEEEPEKELANEEIVEEEPEKAVEKKKQVGKKEKKKVEKKKQVSEDDKKGKYTRAQAFCDALQGEPKTIEEIGQRILELYKENDMLNRKPTKLKSVVWAAAIYIHPLLLLGFVRKEEGKYMLVK